MPTIIAVDCSLSMSRTSTLSGDGGPVNITLKQLSQQVCHSILTYLSTRVKLEYTALLSFSSCCQQLSEFTRDYDALKACVSKIKVNNKACLEPLFVDINTLVSTHFGYMVPCNIIIVTDGRLNWSADIKDVKLENVISRLSTDFPLKCLSELHFICVSSRKEFGKSRREPIVQEIIKANHGKGTLSFLELSQNASRLQMDVENMVKEFTSKHLKIYSGKLHCGRLKNEIVLFPHPPTQLVPGDPGQPEIRAINSDIHVVGFLNISDVKSPSAASRHLVLPSGNNQVLADEQEATSQDVGNLPSFIVALHGSLKLENKVALVHVGEDWYGILGSWTDQKKKANLVLSLFAIGTNCVPWLGSFDDLGPPDGAPPPDKKHTSAFCPGHVKSYAQNLVVWTRPTGLQTDVQKLLRNAKKLPEKTQIFYKDLNRIRKAALAFGFLELLDGVASILERECTMLPGTSHPEAALQLSHAAQELRTLKGFENFILPLKTDFKYHSR